MKVYHEPRGDGVRVDTGVTPGSEISMYYDPMVSKLVTIGRDRGDSLARMRTALDAYVVRGLTANVPFLRSMLDVPDFAHGRYDTGFIKKHYKDKGKCLAGGAFVLGGVLRVGLGASLLYWESSRQALLAVAGKMAV